MQVFSAWRAYSLPAAATIWPTLEFLAATPYLNYHAAQ